MAEIGHPSRSSHGGQSLLIVMHSTFRLELDAITDEELATVSLLKLSNMSELLAGCSSAELLETICTSSLLLGKTSPELLATSVSQAASANARSDTAESPHAMLVFFFFMTPPLFLFFSG
jgi:hypothetical protein